MSEVRSGGDGSEPVPLLAPREGLPPLIEQANDLAAAARAIEAGTGPLALDAERASAYRYSARAYLIQLRRAGSGTFLIDPIPLRGSFAPLATVINPLEWVLHAADQDLPGLAELGLTPTALFDTELASRLAGLERVGLAAISESLLGFTLAKGHGAADWSSRPLPSSWLNYAALDVEILLDLREALDQELAEQGKREWAAEEFEFVRTRPALPPSPERWRRTANIHTIRDKRGLATARELWFTRDMVAEQEDIAPKRILPDSAIVAAAARRPRTAADLRTVPGFGGPRQRRRARVWLDAVERARTLPGSQLPPLRAPADSTARGAARPRPGTDAANRLSAVRKELAVVSDEVSVPVENLLAPDLVRRLCASPPEPATSDSLMQALKEGEARPWQIALAVQPLVTALSAPVSAYEKDA
ncbi:HRDC domain-containing protein [Hoyosella altamirensis]|uniref:Ribonuclease D n=1 Tax=Hoyosella altamirensis TaxID=616997 RepID=A0A839RQC8_9ACTN|nr:HRDC domain-containing protein [Hoyosella altamirensis]MBB3038428.1 ribonuclease D [Hoyosella altamirensis]